MEVLHVWTYQPFDFGLVIPLSLVFLTCGIRDINNVYFVELFFFFSHRLKECAKGN